jgi:hypothetical protein
MKKLLLSPYLVCAFLLLGTATRCRQYLACVSFWYDEAYLLLNIYERPCRDLLGALEFNVVISPAFLWALRGLYDLAGGGELAMRLPAFVAGLAGVWLMQPLARRFSGLFGVVCAVGLCAVSDHGLMHCCEVRSYTVDLLVTEGILVLTASWLCSASSSEGRSYAWLGAAAALLGPWISFPSVFVLAGASLAIALHVFRQTERAARGQWLLFNACLLLSVAALWYYDARFLYYDGLRAHWDGWQGFPQGSAFSVVVWPVRCLLQIADYGTSSMGIPLLLLGLWGVGAVWRRSRPQAILLLAPLAMAMGAAFLRRYPMSDRTVFFATPCIWLLAAAGLDELLQYRSKKVVWLGFATGLVLLLPGTVRFARDLVLVTPKVEYREAFAYVHQNQSPDDAIWVLHPEVYEVYFGRQHCPLNTATTPQVIERIARGRRLWVVSMPFDPAGQAYPWSLRSLQSPDFVILDRQSLKGLEVLLFAPNSPGVAPGHSQADLLLPIDAVGLGSLFPGAYNPAPVLIASRREPRGRESRRSGSGNLQAHQDLPESPNSPE